MYSESSQTFEMELIEKIIVNYSEKTLSFMFDGVLNTF